MYILYNVPILYTKQKFSWYNMKVKVANLHQARKQIMGAKKKTFFLTSSQLFETVRPSNKGSFKIPGVYKVLTNLISFPTPLFSNSISFPRPPYSGGSGGPPPGNFVENGLLNRAFLGHFSAFWLMAGWVRTLSEPAPEPPLKF